jgi:hypothetical protein
MRRGLLSAKFAANRSNVRIFIFFVILLVGLLAYRDIFDLYFTGTDTLTLIDTSRIKSSDDLLRIFSQPMMGGTSFADRYQYFRPITTLSFSIDYALWGLNPWGYHLTNLLLHVLCACLLYWIVDEISGGYSGVAILGALLFTIHPVLAQNVSVISHRQDLLAALFSLMSLRLVVSFMQSRTEKSAWYMRFAVLFSCFAMAAKEVGFLSPFYLFSYFLLFASSNEGSMRDRIRYALRLSIPFILAALLMMVWRTIALDGVGIVSSSSIGDILHTAKDIIINFFTALVDPGYLILTQLKRIYSIHPSNNQLVLSALLILCSLAILYYLRDAVMMWIGTRRNPISKAFTFFLLGLLCISILAIISYPLIAHFFGNIIEDTYYGHGWDILLKVMEGRDRTPLEQYLLRMRDTVIGVCYRIAIFSVLAIVAFGTRLDREKDRADMEDRIMRMMMLWILFSLVLFCVTSIGSKRNFYFSVAAFSTIFAILLLRSVTTFIRKIPVKAKPAMRVRYGAGLLTSVFFLSVVGMIFAYLLAYSAIFRDLKKWERNGTVSRLFFSELDNKVPEFPRGATLTISGLPSLNNSSLLDYTVKSWLDLHYPGNEMSVTFGDRVPSVECIKCLQIEVIDTGNKSFDLRVEFPTGGEH